LRSTLLFTGVRVNSYSELNEAVVLPRCNIARGVRLSKVVVDARVDIPEGLVVGEDPEFDAKWFRRTENGVVLITQPMINKYLASK
jgi:glucose-1-phosphate adenylyltransferase